MKIAFISSPLDLHQTSNGGSISMRALVRELVHAGASCETFSHSVSAPGAAPGPRHWTERLGGAALHHHAVAVQLGMPRRQRVQAFHEMVDRRLRAAPPDLVISWPVDAAWDLHRIHDLAHDLGSPVAMNLLTHDRATLTREGRNADVLWVPSDFMRRACRSAFDGPVRTLYPIVDDERCVGGAGARTHVTFINPIPAKGLTLFLRLAAIAQEERPELRFLVVESRWTERDLWSLGLAQRDLWNVEFVRQTGDMREIYRRTKVLLVPSFWDEAFGMVVVEAQRNGIPVLASRRGGLVEALQGASPPLGIPDRCRKDHMAIPTAREVSWWRRRLWRLLDDPDAYVEASARARLASSRCAPPAIRQRALELVVELLGSTR